MKKFLLSLCLISTIAHAGHDTGGGGIGLKVRNNIYLYDFVEAGIEDTAFINNSIQDEMKAGKTVRTTLIVSKEAQDLVISKFNEIYRLSPTFALKLLDTLRMYQWRFVKPSLLQTRDIGRTPINVNLSQLQLAYRDDSQKTVTIDKENLGKMPVSHQVGLYFHEIIYALSNHDDSYKSRQFTSFIFHPGFEFATFEQFLERVQLVYKNKFLLMDYDTFTDINSSEFKKACRPFQQEVAKFNGEALNFIQTQVGLIENNLMKASLEDASSSLGSPTSNHFDSEFSDRMNFKYNLVTYSLLKYEHLPKYVYKVITTMFSHEKKYKVYYSLPAKAEKILETNKTKSATFRERNDNEFHGACIVNEDKVALNYINSLRVIYNDLK